MHLKVRRERARGKRRREEINKGNYTRNKERGWDGRKKETK